MSKAAATIPERTSELLERVEVKTSQRYRWVIFSESARLNAFLSSFLNSHVHELPTDRRRGGMNERHGGRGVRRGWKLGHEGEERENKSPSEEDDASWLEKQQGILSPTRLSALIFGFLSSLIPHTSLCPAEIQSARPCTLLSSEWRSHTCMRTRLNCWSTSHDETEEPISMLDILRRNRLNWYRQRLVPRQLKAQK